MLFCVNYYTDNIIYSLLYSKGSLHVGFEGRGGVSLVAVPMFRLLGSPEVGPCRSGSGRFGGY